MKIGQHVQKSQRHPFPVFLPVQQKPSGSYMYTYMELYNYNPQTHHGFGPSGGRPGPPDRPLVLTFNL